METLRVNYYKIKNALEEMFYCFFLQNIVIISKIMTELWITTQLEKMK